MFALTVDQRSSRESADAVDDAIERLCAAEAAGALKFALSPERTSGDEFQCLLADAESTYSAVRILARDGRWHIGVGVGPAELPLPSSVRESRGPALVRARGAVEAAKAADPSIVLIGESEAAIEANGILQLVGTLWGARSDLGWQAIAALERQDGDASLTELAGKLGISKQALSQRLQAARWQVEQTAKDAVINSLARADEQAVE